MSEDLESDEFEPDEPESDDFDPEEPESDDFESDGLELGLLSGFESDLEPPEAVDDLLSWEPDPPPDTPEDCCCPAEPDALLPAGAPGSDWVGCEAVDGSCSVCILEPDPDEPPPAEPPESLVPFCPPALAPFWTAGSVVVESCVVPDEVVLLVELVEVGADSAYASRTPTDSTVGLA